jgi:hypothetical protein
LRSSASTCSARTAAACISVWKNSIGPRSLRRALCSALSASRSSDSASSRSLSLIATPTRQRGCSCWPLPSRCEGGECDQLLADAQGVDRAFHAVEQHGELVSADPRAHIALAHQCGDVIADPAQQFVADDVAVAVIDEAEALQVDRQDRDLGEVAASPLGECAVGVLDEHRAVGQAGEAVVQRVMYQLLFGALAQVDVAERSRHPVGMRKFSSRSATPRIRTQR